MTDNEFLTAMGIQGFSGTLNCLTPIDPLTEALRIDDDRSEYCELLEVQIVAQAREIAALRRILGWEPPPRRDRQDPLV